MRTGWFVALVVAREWLIHLFDRALKGSSRSLIVIISSRFSDYLGLDSIHSCYLDRKSVV